jgi:hypothetical protein
VSNVVPLCTSYASSSSNALASFRSSVPKPSVNAEIGEHAITQVFGDVAAIALDEIRAACVIGGDDPAHVFGIEPRGERRRTDEIAEHDGQLPALGEDPQLIVPRSFHRYPFQALTPR